MGIILTRGRAPRQLGKLPDCWKKFSLLPEASALPSLSVYRNRASGPARQLDLSRILPEHGSHSHFTHQENVQTIKKNLLLFDVIRPFRKGRTALRSGLKTASIGREGLSSYARVS